VSSFIATFLFAWFDFFILTENFTNPAQKESLFSLYDIPFPRCILGVHLFLSLTFTLGLFTRTSQFGLIIFHYSINARFAGNEGDAILFHLLVLTLFLPTSLYWSFDSGTTKHLPAVISCLLIIISWKTSSILCFLLAIICTAASIRFNLSFPVSPNLRPSKPSTDPISTSVSSIGLFCMLFALYTFRVLLYKINEDNWIPHLTAVKNILSSNLATKFGKWSRLNLSFFIKLSSIVLPIIEFSAPIVMYLQIRVQITCIALLSLILLHILSEIFLVLDVHSLVCISFLFSFIPRQFWNALNFPTEQRKHRAYLIDIWALFRIGIISLIVLNEAVNSLGLYLVPGILPPAFHLTDRFDSFTDANLNFRWWRIGGMRDNIVYDLPIEKKMDWWKFPNGASSWVNAFETARIARYHDAIYEKINVENWAKYWCSKYPKMSYLAIVLQIYQSDLQRDQIASEDAVTTVRRLLTSTDQEVVHLKACQNLADDSSAWFYDSFFTNAKKPAVEKSKEVCFREDNFRCNENREYHYRTKSGVEILVDDISECEAQCLSWFSCSNYVWFESKCFLSWTCTRESATTPITNERSIMKESCVSDPLPYCEIVTGWDAGLGDCSAYERGSRGFYRCWGDKDLGYTAFEVCPQCLRCQIMEIPEPRAISPLEIGTKKKEIYNGRTSVDELEEELRLLDYLMLQDELNEKSNWKKKKQKRKQKKKRRKRKTYDV